LKSLLLRTALFWAITQRVVVVYYRRFGTTCRSCLQESNFIVARVFKFISPYMKVIGLFSSSWKPGIGPYSDWDELAIPCHVQLLKTKLYEVHERNVQEPFRLAPQEVLKQLDARPKASYSKV